MKISKSKENNKRLKKPITVERYFQANLRYILHSEQCDMQSVLKSDPTNS